MSDSKIFDRKTILKIILGTLVGGLAVYFAFRGVALEELGRVLREADPWLVILGVGIVLLNVASVSLRWWVMLLLPWGSSTYRSLLGGVYLGQMFNILLPARLGELARILFASERTGTTKSRLLGSLMLEKGVDLITFGLALLLLIAAVSLPAWVADSGDLTLILTGVALLAVVLLVLWGRPALRWITPLLRKLPQGWGERLAGILERTLSGFDAMRSWRRQLGIWGLAVFSLGLSALTNYVILQAVGIPVPFTAALFVLIVLQVGSAPPSAPGKLGVFHYLTVLALSAFQVEKDLALAYAVLLYMVALMPKVILGVGVVVFSKWRLPDFRIRWEPNG